MSKTGFLLRCSTLGLRTRTFQRLCLRTFLSDGYKCEDKWKGRLNTPLLLKLKNENLYADLLKMFQNEGKASAVDVDLFSNLVVREGQLDELEDVTHKFRRCVNTAFTLPSTGHAVIRTFFEFNNTDTLMRMLDDRLNYGLFLDYYLSNLLMDSFLKENNFRDAAKVAVQMMLQEEFDHPITSLLALHSCHAYLRKPQPDPWDPQPKRKPEEPVEVVKVRVDYIREPYFDDHFDLTEPNHLIGKTLASFGKQLALQPADPVAHTSILVGWTLFEKHENILRSLDAMLASSDKPLVFRQELEFCKNTVGKASKLPDNFLEEFNSRIGRLEAGGLIADGDLQELLKRRIQKAVDQHELSDIEAQVEQYSKWEKQRADEVDKQIRAMEHRRRSAILEQKKKELQEKEERLAFFDNQDYWELKHEEKEQERAVRAKALRSKKVSSKALRLAEEEAYFPPELVKKSTKNQ